MAGDDAAPDGEKGAVLRREDKYSSHVIEWRRARDASAPAGLKAPRGRRRRDPQAERIARLEAENKQLEQELAKARFVVEEQGKLHALLETIAKGATLRRMTATEVTRWAPLLPALLDNDPDEQAGAALRARRDKAMLLVGYAAALRRSELVALDVHDVSENDSGLVVFVARPKTDQACLGDFVGIALGHPASRARARAPSARGRNGATRSP